MILTHSASVPFNFLALLVRHILSQGHPVACLHFNLLAVWFAELAGSSQPSTKELLEQL